MTDLEFYTVLSAMWLSIAWLPYILDRIMVRGLFGALANYSTEAIPQSAWAQRAQRAHIVAVEAFVVYVPLAILTMIKMPDDALAGTLAFAFFAGILAHYIIYVLGLIVLRTLAFCVAFLSSFGLGLNLLGVI
ncbi:MAPEG family protein [Shimia thalassica]|uniref:MAPEG family protein n=1 Tax=Shimia thalassica TaxID=1715693 RepID=UPI000C0869AC|nr:MAPEG family protein [Shimia thalassica]PHO05465.1 hypothetical protein CSC82_03610 [Rhodobacteraceae bacterium 4F10]MDO6523118.1 MAPEG family protein [Shimia thalassica]MDP2495755.1 MAPEG family protein [Shimia thalassica]MDP2519952.1 MAPEG family protein [Shimia thalassica]MDP2581075.1 MAPEG family protein [Shimia thalassica]